MLDKFKKNKEDLMVVAPFSNIYEKANDIMIAVEMPGVDKETLSVNIDGNQLIIRGIKKKDDVSKDYTPLYRERTPVAYERRFDINTQIDRDKISAEYKEGVLKVALAKAQAAAPQKIEITA